VAAAQRLQQAGAFLSTQEMALFQLAGHAKVGLKGTREECCCTVHHLSAECQV